MKLPVCGAVLAALLVPSLSAQNLLVNPSFEDAGGSFAGWGAFGNANPIPANPPAVTPRTGNTLASLFGNFSGGFDVIGIFQSFPAAPGQTFTIDCWSRHFSGDALVGAGAPNDNWVVMKIAFFNGAGGEIAGFEGTVLDGTSPTDTWIDNAPVSGTAPAGTASVQALILFLQPGNAPGAAQIDDVEFTGPGGSAAYPGTGEDVTLATGVAGGMATSGIGFDVKQASAGDLLEVNVSSPQGGYALRPYIVVGQLFSTGSPPTPQIADFWFSLNQPLGFLVGTGNGPFGPAIIAPGAGSSSYFRTPMGLGGLSLMLQAVVVDSGASNGQWALSDAHEIQL